MRRHVPGWIVVAIAGAASWSIGATVPVGAADSSVPVELNGSGDSELSAEFTSWQDTMFAADQPTDISYFQRGSSDGRARLLDGSKQFVISGVPFTAAELAGRPGNAGAIIEAPLAVSSLSAIVTTPPDSWSTTTFVCDPNDPLVEDPDACVVHGAYAGPIRLPPENLSALALGLSPTFQNNGLGLWRDPNVLTAMGFAPPSATLALQVPQLDAAAPGKEDTWMNRQEGSAASKSLMTYAQALAPTAWGLRGQEFPGFVLDANQERFGTRNLLREGETTVVGLVALYKTDVFCNCVQNAWAGNATAVSSTSFGQVVTDAPDARFREVEVQNKHGDWVLPTRASLEAAIAAGVDIDSGAIVDAPGAYPFTWISRLYTVAGTLDPDEANALAATIRYIATDGQDLVVAKGGAPLNASLRAEALSAADQVVAGNCTQAGYEIVASGPSSFEPNTPTVQALHALKHCQPAPPPPTTTTTTTSTTTTTLAPTSTSTTVAATTTNVQSSPAEVPVVSRTTPSPSAGAAATSVNATTTTTSPPETTTTTTARATTTTTSTTSVPPLPAGLGSRPRGRALSSLPLQLPPDGSEGFKKLGSLLLGAGMFLGGRRFVLSRRVSQ
jgi:PBP superfamily domain